MDERLKQQLEFVLEIDKEKNIFRQTHLSGQGRNENDAEHAWHMAIMEKMQNIYLKYWLAGDILQKTDRMSMAHSLEVRVPFLDRDVFEAARTLPPEAKFARAMDNLQPLLLNDSNDGGDWKEHEVNAEKVYGRQRKTKRGSEKLFEVTDQILKENIAKGNLPE